MGEERLKPYDRLAGFRAQWDELAHLRSLAHLRLLEVHGGELLTNERLTLLAELPHVECLDLEFSQTVDNESDIEAVLGGESAGCSLNAKFRSLAKPLAADSRRRS